MITFISVLLIIFAIIMAFVYPVLRKEDGEPTRFGEVKRKSPEILLMWHGKNRFKLILLAIALIVADMSTIFAKEGHQYYVLTPTGHRYAITTPGFKMIVPFSKVQEWSKYMEVKAVKVNPETGEFLEDVSGIEGVIPGGVSVMFIDRATAKVFISARFEIPVDEDQFIKLVETYKTPENLVNNTLLQTINEQLTNITFMYSADDYVSGGATDYKLTAEDALKNGGYVVRREEVIDTLFTPEVLTVDSLVSKPRAIQEIRKFTKNSKVLENGIPKRVPHEINTNKVLTAQVIVSDVVLEQSFTDKLKQQRDISAEKIIEIQKIETARAAQQRIIAEGERDKAAERVAQEKAQVSKLINIETQVKEEESKRQLAQIAVQTAELEAKATLTRERAQAEANRMKVSAGLTPQERAEWEYKTAVGVAAEIKNLKLPETYIQGASGNGGGSILEQLIGAELAKGMLKKNK
jgi:hypothetical protein